MDIRRDARVEAADGELGRVRHVIVDPRTKEVTDLVVAHGHDTWVVPISAVVRAEGSHILLHGERSAYRSGRQFQRDAYHEVDDEQARAESRRVAVRGGAPLLDASDEGVHIGAPPSFAAPGVAAAASGRTAAGEQRPSAVPESPARMELREEETLVRKEQVTAGEVAVRNEVVSEVQRIEVPLRQERVVIERRPVAGYVPATSDFGADEEIRVPLLAEQVRVEKQPVVTEEIEVGARQVEQTRQIAEQVRREELRIEVEGGLRTTEALPERHDH